jgi:hypothetical protein
MEIWRRDRSENEIKYIVTTSDCGGKWKKEKRKAKGCVK